ncbi:DsbA family protein [Pararhodobacter sp. SW119]|uniref:2-hydroxychromene-2-carboxylate isomerase n=1 Tax=Pararhodobacter sp. SW119 TaxID=2780075 RepID=UPI001AE066BB|nr:DsbA family protein [Pararhodobacter sp. SW119]
MPSIDFWFSIGSTYSYLTVMRLPEVARRTGQAFIWRPFDVRRIMVAQNNIPFRDKPVKAAFMWRDIARRAAAQGLSPLLPAPYPLAQLTLANQVALLAAREGWCEAYVIQTYRRWFEGGDPAGEDPNLSDSLHAIGQDPARVLAAATAPAIADALVAETEAARDIGVFGAPSFVVGAEVFWGDDRLEDALDWARHGALSPRGPRAH